MTTYKKEIQKKNIHNRMITLINFTPEFSLEERLEIKGNIEKKLYDVFCKYMSYKP